MIKSNLYIILVIYNEKSAEIDFIKRYENDSRVNLIIVDNSTDIDIANQNDENCKMRAICYLSNKKNLGLSKAYNWGLSKIPKNKENWVMTLDQDTYVSEEYIKNVLISIEETPEIVIKTGLISFGNRIGSPTILNSKKSIDRCGIYTGIEAINSALVLNRQLLENINGYDERLFLDMVDYLLLYKIREIGIETVEVLAGEIKQEFSGETKSTYKNDLVRFNIYKKDFWNYSKITNKSKFNSLFILYKRRLSLFLKYKVLN